MKYELIFLYLNILTSALTASLATFAEDTHNIKQIVEDLSPQTKEEERRFSLSNIFKSPPQSNALQSNSERRDHGNRRVKRYRWRRRRRNHERKHPGAHPHQRRSMDRRNQMDTKVRVKRQKNGRNRQDMNMNRNRGAGPGNNMGPRRRPGNRKGGRNNNNNRKCKGPNCRRRPPGQRVPNNGHAQDYPNRQSHGNNGNDEPDDYWDDMMDDGEFGEVGEDQVYNPAQNEQTEAGGYNNMPQYNQNNPPYGNNNNQPDINNQYEGTMGGTSFVNDQVFNSNQNGNPELVQFPQYNQNGQNNYNNPPYIQNEGEGQGMVAGTHAGSGQVDPGQHEQLDGSDNLAQHNQNGPNSNDGPILADQNANGGQVYNPVQNLPTGGLDSENGNKNGKNNNNQFIFDALWNKSMGGGNIVSHRSSTPDNNPQKGQETPPNVVATEGANGVKSGSDQQILNPLNDHQQALDAAQNILPFLNPGSPSTTEVFYKQESTTTSALAVPFLQDTTVSGLSTSLKVRVPEIASATNPTHTTYTQAATTTITTTKATTAATTTPKSSISTKITTSQAIETAASKKVQIPSKTPTTVTTMPSPVHENAYSTLAHITHSTRTFTINSNPFNNQDNPSMYEHTGDPYQQQQHSPDSPHNSSPSFMHYQDVYPGNNENNYGENSMRQEEEGMGMDEYGTGVNYNNQQGNSYSYDNHNENSNDQFANNGNNNYMAYEPEYVDNSPGDRPIRPSSNRNGLPDKSFETYNNYDSDQYANVNQKQENGDARKENGESWINKASKFFDDPPEFIWKNSGNINHLSHCMYCCGIILFYCIHANANGF